MLTTLIVLFSYSAFAQERLTPIEIHDHSYSPTEFSGWQGEIATLPLALESYRQEDWQNRPVTRLAELTNFDASLTESYSAGGYWDIVSLRGLPLDNRSCYLREGLPISAETVIPLENKASIDLIKGLSGPQWGAPTPAGMVHYQVKRPVPQKKTELKLSWSQANQPLIQADINTAMQEKIKTRVNLAAQKLADQVENSQGERYFGALALDYQSNASNLWQWEIEASRQARPSQAGFSLEGDKLPSVPDPRRNLNNQDWSRPVEFNAVTSTLKNIRELNDDLLLTTTLGMQQLRTDDYLAYPYGCDKEGNYDRFCSDGTFDVYDYRSENERRRTESVRLHLDHQTDFKNLKWLSSLGVISSQFSETNGTIAYNYAGEGNVAGDYSLPANGAKSSSNTHRRNRQHEIYSYHQLQLQAWQFSVKMSYHDIHRQTRKTDHTDKTSLQQNNFIPWLALSHHAEVTSYLSWGLGQELFITPNNTQYDRPGDTLVPAQSQQWEMGVKDKNWSVVAFYLIRPTLVDAAPVFELHGHTLSRGVELSQRDRWKKWSWENALMLLQLERSDGREVTNVPREILRSQVNYHFTTSIEWGLSLKHEGQRETQTSGQLTLPAWQRIDTQVRYRNWLLTVENLTEARYWRESPTQYGHIYLYPGNVRRLSLNWSLTLY